MAKICFTSNLLRHIQIPEGTYPGETVSEILHNVFKHYPLLRSYVLNDQNQMLPHINIFVDGQVVSDRKLLSDKVSDHSEIYVLQALSGG